MARYHSTFASMLFAIVCIPLALATVILPARFATAVSYLEFPSFVDYATTPAEAVRLAASIGDSVALEDQSLLNSRLRVVDIRTALEDTMRLHGELG